MPLPIPPDKMPNLPNYSKYEDDVAAVKQFTDETGIKLTWTPELFKFMKWLFAKKKVDNSENP